MSIMDTTKQEDLLRAGLGLAVAVQGLTMPGLMPGLLFCMLGGWALGSGLGRYCIKKDKGL